MVYEMFKRIYKVIMGLLVIILAILLLRIYAFSEKPIVGVFYYLWFIPNGRWNESKIIPIKYHSLLGKYDSSNETVIKQHIKDMESAGFDFVILSWWGKSDKFIDSNCKKLMKILEETNSKINFCIMAETIKNEEEDLNYIYNTFVKSSKYQYFKGKPLLFTWREKSSNSSFYIIHAKDNWIPWGVYPEVDMRSAPWMEFPLYIPRSELLYVIRLNIAYLYNQNPITVMTWNEFQENSCIEPTEEFGYAYVDLTRMVINFWDFLLGDKK
jgi:hypothetical protein